MTTQEMRNAIEKVYPGPGWRRKVANMAEGQVIAVYLAFEKNGTFNRDLKKHNKQFKEKGKKPTGYSVQQLTIDDIL